MSFKKENILKSYSQKLLIDNPKIKEKRNIGYINDFFLEVKDFNELECYPSINSRLKKYIPRTQIVYTSKLNKKGDYMKWHCDDAIIISNKKENMNKYINQIKISDKKSLFYPNKIPKFSLIIYGSSYKDDFTGGIFEFSDGTKIKPERNLCILFDSREAHCVHKIKSGTRKLILMKFY